MSDVKLSLAFAEALYRALKFLQLYPAEDRKAKAVLEAMEQAHNQLFIGEGQVVLEVSSPQARLYCNGNPLDARTQAVSALTQLLRERRIQRAAFLPGVESDEFQLFFFILQLPPQRLLELGGPSSFEAEFTHIGLSEAPAPLPRAETPAVEPAPAFGAEAPPAPAPQTEAVRLDAPRPAFPELEPFKPEETVAAPAPAAPPPPPPNLGDALRLKFTPAAVDARRSPVGPTAAVWSHEQLECLRRCSLTFSDLAPLAGAGDELNLNQTDPITLRDGLRQALALLPPGAQGAVLLGLPTFPSGEQALRRALDYLAPELLAQAAAEVQSKFNLPNTQLALVVAAMLQCVKDRDLSMEALKGRLQLEGWTLQDCDDLQEAVLWECQGTDTKLRDAIQEQGVMELDTAQVISLIRQALRQGRGEALNRLLEPIESGLYGDDIGIRRQASQLLANLADCLEDPGLPDDVQVKLLDLLHAHLNHEQDTEAMQWSAQAMEALLSHSISRGQFPEAYRIVLALLDLSSAHAGIPQYLWKAQAIQDLLVRLAGPLNMAALVPLLHQKRGELSTPQVHSLLAVMGQPAARYLVVCLGIEEDRNRRTHLLDALRAIGPRAAAPLREALSAPEWYLTRNAVLLLGEIGDREAFDEVSFCLTHRDARVRRAAARTLTRLDGPRAVPLLAQVLPSSDPGTKLDVLALLGELKDLRAVAVLSELLSSTKPSGEEADRLRLRAVEALGAIAAPETVPVLARIFKKRGLLQAKESLGVRLAAARALAAVGTLEAREAMALAIEDESRDEVRSVLRQFLIGGS